MLSTELTSIQAPREPAADLKAPRWRSPHDVTASHQADLAPLAHLESVGRDTIALSRADRRRGASAVHVAARWMLRVLAECGRAWALAAGVPPNLPPDLVGRRAPAAIFRTSGGTDRHT